MNKLYLPLAGEASSLSSKWPKWLFPGWYVAAPSDTLKPGAIAAIVLAGKPYVVFRTRQGVPVVVERFCVHQGASLEGGSVVGETLRCAFHHWEFDTSGKCTKIPNCSKIPSRAKLDTLPVIERYGWIWVHLGDSPVDRSALAADLVPSSEGWKRVATRDVGLAKTTCRDMFENIADFAHLGPIHQMKQPDGHQYHCDIVDGKFQTKFGPFEYPGKTKAKGVSMIYPPALWYSYLDGSFLNGALSHRSALLVALQPVSEFETRCYSAVFIQQRRGAQLGHFVAGKVIGRLWTHGLVQDMAIWQRKIIRPDPILSTWDGPIIRYRDWWEKAEHSARGISDSVDEDSNSPVG